MLPFLLILYYIRYDMPPHLAERHTYIYKISRAISASKLQGVQTFPPHQRVNKAPAVFKEQTYPGKNPHAYSWRRMHDVEAISLISLFPPSTSFGYY